MTGRALLTNRKMATAYGCICAGAYCRHQSPAKIDWSQFYQKTKRSKRFPVFLQAAGRQRITNNYRLLTIQMQNPVEKCCTWAFLNTSGKPHVLPCHWSVRKVACSTLRIGVPLTGKSCGQAREQGLPLLSLGNILPEKDLAPGH